MFCQVSIVVIAAPTRLHFGDVERVAWSAMPVLYTRSFMEFQDQLICSTKVCGVVTDLILRGAENVIDGPILYTILHTSNAPIGIKIRYR